jgi:putative transposase
MGNICFKRHRFPPEVIRHAVWLYARFTMSYRAVEYLVAERGLDISYETVRRWFLKFGAPIARNLRHMRPTPSDYWHLDEMVIVIRGRRSGWKQQRFKSPGSAQRFLNIQSAVYNTFYVQRHLLNRPSFKRIRTDAFNVWESAGAGA